MTIFKNLQEDGLFGIAGKLEVKLHDRREYKALRQRLKKKGLTDYQIDLIREAVLRPVRNIDGTTTLKYSLGDRFRPERDYDNEIEAIKNLRYYGYIWTDPKQDHWFLNRLGLEVRSEMESLMTREEKIALVHDGKEVASVTVLPSTVDHQTDISFARDGFLNTVSKLWWVVTHGPEIEAQRRKEFIEEFQRGQKEIDNALQMIATSEQRVSRRLIEQGPPPAPKSSWTEEEQRAQNDKYWISSGSAFWLNPKGVLADPTPAPEWWSPPADYKSLTQRHLEARQEDDIVAKSLEAPVSQSKVITTTERYLDPLLETRELTKKQIELSTEFSYFAQDQRTNKVYAFRTDKWVNAWYEIKEKAGIPVTVAARGTITYGDLLRIYEIQSATKEEKLDELFSELDQLSNELTDDFDTWVDLYQFNRETPVKIRTGAPRRSKAVEAAGFVMVEFDGVVRGFPSRLEAETWLGEQRTEMEFRRKKMEQMAEISSKKIEIQKANEQALDAAARNKANADAIDILARLRAKSARM